MSQIIDGKALSKSIRAEVKKEVETLKEKSGKTPHLVVVLVGENPASQTYVRMKHKACEKAGIRSTIINKDPSISEGELLGLIHELNDDDDVHGILVQLPLPKHMDANKVINTISYQKDVDGFHPMNIAALQIGTEGIIPATPKGIMTLLDHTGIKLEGKNAVIIGRSNIVGKPVAQLLLKANATVTIAHSRTRNLGELAASADVLVAAVGRPKMVTADMVKEGATVIDVGVNRVEGKLVGDVDFEHVKDKAASITPVPGGVGPMTIASLLENTVECFKTLEK
ncbi:MAG: bifunctional methylenetetrahydrofolate dehydrogenase/methenyltetrahydrofolate cyclohydrolase FolD [Bacillota bacterium]